MGTKLLRRYKFTCNAVSLGAPGMGLFMKGQVVIVNEDDNRLPFFRGEHGFKEEALPAIEVDDGQPVAAPEDGSGSDPDGGDGDVGEDVTMDTPLTQVEGVRTDIAEKLADANIVTIANAKAVGFEGLIAVPGVGEKSAQAIMEICEDVAKTE